MSKSMTVTIEIISDTICPWCYIGKRRLETAIERFRNSSPSRASTKFDIRWKPFYLGPPDSAVGSKMQRYAEKYGALRTQQMVPYMQQMGSTVGISFDYGGPIGPTFLSHRVIQYVQDREPERTNAVIEALFAAYFEKQGNIFTKPTLLAILHEDKVELDYAALESFMDDTNARKEIDQEVMEAQAKAVSGVPDFTIQGKYHLNGAQEPESFTKIFEQLV